MSTRLLAAATLLAATFAACTMDFGTFTFSGHPGCTPGEVRACTGPGACTGTQVCAADGQSLSACQCGGDPGGGGGASAGNGGTSVTGGQGGSGGVAAGGADAGASATGGSATGGGAPCGNGALDAAEECDDGNPTPSDGCSGDCALEGAGDECPTGIEVELGPAGIWITDTTAGKATDNNTTCGGNSAGDMAFLITPAQSGDVTVSLTGDFDKVLALRNACTDSDGWYCDTGTGELSDSFAVTADEPFHVIVTGTGGDEGAFTLHVFYP